MSQGRTNTGCGITQPFAAIAVTYPKGGIITCSDGSVTLGAKNANGRWIFNIPYAGTWTVRGTYDIHQGEFVVEDVVEGQYYEVKPFAIPRKLFGEGITDDWFMYPGASITDDCIIGVTKDGQSGTGVRTNELIDMNGVERIDVNVTFNKQDQTLYTSSKYCSTIFVGLVSESEDVEDTSVHSLDMVTYESLRDVGIISLDVSDYNGKYYVFVKMSSVLNSTGTKHMDGEAIVDDITLYYSIDPGMK